MHLINEIIQALLVYIRVLAGFIVQYLRALSGGTRATLLARLGTAFCVLGGLVYFTSSSEANTLAVVDVLRALALVLACAGAFLIVIAFPGAKRFFGFAGIMVALTFVAAHFILSRDDPWLLLLASSLAALSFSVALVDARYLTGYIRATAAEWRVALILKRFTGKTGGLINNAVFTSPSGSTEIDHILVNRAGVFVVETKGLSGVIRCRAGQDVWHQVMSKTLTHELLSPVIQNAAHAKVVQRIVGDDVPLYNIVVFTNAKLVGEAPNNVVHIKHLGRLLKSFKMNALSDQMTQTLLARIDASIDKSRHARSAHISRVAEKRLTEYAD